MEILLTAINPRLTEAWSTFFTGVPGVRIVEEDITRLDSDAVVSPANSFGFMDGGIDHALSERFGWNLEKRLQSEIQALPEGELLVGQAILLETGDARTPFLIAAPTMRVPSNFNIDTSVNAYLAMKAVLIKAAGEPRIQTVALPGLCTGIGGMQPMIAARQMYMAWKEILGGGSPQFANFAEAQQYHWEINPQGTVWKG